MANGTGATNTYDLTTGIMLDIESMLSMLSPTDTPLLGGLGGDASLALPTGPCFEKKVEWLDEDILTPRTTIQTGCTTGDGFIIVASGERTRFQTGDLVLVGSEYMRVTGYGNTADYLLVTRAYSGSAATVTANTVVIGVGSALPEGSDPPTARFVDRVNRYNVTEIFGPIKVESTESDLAVRKYGVSNEFDHQAGLRVKEVGIGLEQTLWYGVRVEDLTNKWRSMGGMLYYITTNNDASTTSLTEAAELAALQTCFAAGGSPNILAVGPKQKTVVSGWTSSGVIEVMRADGTRGLKVDVFESDFGTVRVMLDRWLRVQDAVNFQRDQAEHLTLRGLSFEMLGKTGDSRKGQIVTERSLRFRRQRHAHRFSALT